MAFRGLFHPGHALYHRRHFVGPVKVQASDRANVMIKHYGYKVENDLFWAGFGRGWEGAELLLFARHRRRGRPAWWQEDFRRDIRQSLSRRVPASRCGEGRCGRNKPKCALNEAERTLGLPKLAGKLFGKRLIWSIAR
jgi:hypothetical protein